MAINGRTFLWVTDFEFVRQTTKNTFRVEKILVCKKWIELLIRKVENYTCLSIQPVTKTTPWKLYATSL